MPAMLPMATLSHNVRASALPTAVRAVPCSCAESCRRGSLPQRAGDSQSQIELHGAVEFRETGEIPASASPTAVKISKRIIGIDAGMGIAGAGWKKNKLHCAHAHAHAH